MHHPTDRITHTTAFVTPVVEHWLEWEIAQWVHDEGSIRWPIAPWANALTTELLYWNDWSASWISYACSRSCTETIDFHCPVEFLIIFLFIFYLFIFCPVELPVTAWQQEEVPVAGVDKLGPVGGGRPLKARRAPQQREPLSVTQELKTVQDQV